MLRYITRYYAAQAMLATRATLCYACYASCATLRYSMLLYATLAMLCYAMLCYAMLCYAMLCYAFPTNPNGAAPPTRRLTRQSQQHHPHDALPTPERPILMAQPCEHAPAKPGRTRSAPQTPTQKQELFATHSRNMLLRAPRCHQGLRVARKGPPFLQLSEVWQTLGEALLRHLGHKVLHLQLGHVRAHLKVDRGQYTVLM